MVFLMKHSLRGSATSLRWDREERRPRRPRVRRGGAREVSRRSVRARRGAWPRVGFVIN